jgi:hypothetical protein
MTLGKERRAKYHLRNIIIDNKYENLYKLLIFDPRTRPQLSSLDFRSSTLDNYPNSWFIGYIAIVTTKDHPFVGKYKTYPCQQM